MRFWPHKVFLLVKVFNILKKYVISLSNSPYLPCQCIPGGWGFFVDVWIRRFFFFLFFFESLYVVLLVHYHTFLVLISIFLTPNTYICSLYKKVLCYYIASSQRLSTQESNENNQRDRSNMIPVSCDVTRCFIAYFWIVSTYYVLHTFVIYAEFS